MLKCPPHSAPYSIERPLGAEWGGHFNIYVGELFEKTIADQVAFLTGALGVEAPAPSAAPASEAEAGAQA